MLQHRHHSMNSNSYPNPCIIKQFSNNYNTAFPQIHFQMSCSLHSPNFSFAVCFLVKPLLSGDSSGDVAPSSSLDSSQGSGWAPFLCLMAPSVLTHKSSFPSLPHTHKSLCTSCSITPLPAQGQLGQKRALYFLHPPPSPFLLFSIIFLISPPSLLPPFLPGQHCQHYLLFFCHFLLT